MSSGNGISSVLVLWDVDLTLVRTRGVGVTAYERAFRELFGRELPPERVLMAGRTDRAIAVELLTNAGVADPRARVEEFQAAQARYAGSLADLVRERGEALPGAAKAIAALAQPRPGLRVVQSLLTGNIRAMSDVKLGALGLTRHLDPDAGAYGTESEIRADLVPVARRNAAERYGTGFDGPATVLIGDTPLDVEAARMSDARAVGVATGIYSADDLADAGADAVLPDLTDAARVVRAVLGSGVPG